MGQETQTPLESCKPLAHEVHSVMLLGLHDEQLEAQLRQVLFVVKVKPLMQVIQTVELVQLWQKGPQFVQLPFIKDCLGGQLEQLVADPLQAVHEPPQGKQDESLR